MFRYVEHSSGVQPNPYGTYAVPRDFVDIASGEDPSKLMDLLHLVIMPILYFNHGLWLGRTYSNSGCS